MGLTEIIKTRRSIRKFKTDDVPKELIEKIVEAGLCAASGRGKQSSKIIVIKDKEIKKELSKLNAQIGGYEENFDPFYNAPVIILVVADMENKTAVYDGSLTLGNMMLKAHELGLGSCWIHRAKEEMESDFGKSLLQKLGLQGQNIGVGHLALGYSDSEKKDAPKIKDGRVFWI